MSRTISAARCGSDPSEARASGAVVTGDIAQGDGYTLGSTLLIQGPDIASRS